MENYGLQATFGSLPFFINKNTGMPINLHIIYICFQAIMTEIVVTKEAI